MVRPNAANVGQVNDGWPAAPGFFPVEKAIGSPVSGANLDRFLDHCRLLIRELRSRTEVSMKARSKSTVSARSFSHAEQWDHFCDTAGGRTHHQRTLLEASAARRECYCALQISRPAV